MDLSKLQKRLRGRIKRALRGQKTARYPLTADREVRNDIVRFPIHSRAWIEVFWKEIEFGTGPAFSLYVDQYEVLRFDCSGPDTGHYHVANQTPFCRVWMYEQEVASQIERGLFEIEKNYDFYLGQNPIPSVRTVELDSAAVGNACTLARPRLLGYAELMSRSKKLQPAPLAGTPSK